MGRHLNKRLAGLLTTGVLVLAVAMTIGLQSSLQAASSPNSVDVIRQFTGNPNLNLVAAPPAPHPAGIQTSDFTTSDGNSIFTVDTLRGQVVAAEMLAGPGNAAGRDQALSIARSFAASRVLGFDKLSLTNGASQAEGQAPLEYNFMWAQLVGPQGALGLQRVSVSVDAASGSITSFMQIPAQPVSVDTTPAISRDEAIAIATKDFGANVVSSSAELQVWWKGNDRSQPQVLRWYVTLEGGTDPSGIATGVAYTIDAHTGEILERMDS